MSHPQLLAAQAALMKELHFTPGDLAANRAGLLTGRQRERIGTLQRGKAMMGSFFMIGLALFIASAGVIEFTRPDTTVPIWLELALFTLTALLGFGGVYSAFYHSQRQRVHRLEGPVFLEIFIPEWARDESSAQYELSLRGKRFLLTAEALEAFIEGENYRLFYIHFQGQPHILSAEWIEGEIV